MTQSRHSIMSHLMSLSGVKRTCPFAMHMSAFDPKRTFSVMSPFSLRWVEIPKCDNHRLRPLVASAVRNGTGCGLTVYWLDTVAFGGKPIVDLFFKSRIL